jgi:hypothetical protein
MSSVLLPVRTSMVVGMFTSGSGVL